ncbi:6-phosphofructokinase [Halobacillus litoralis]|uniref:ATP-dependent 6-phosphofructokinase n=1 Tax=Halobacillus litoralis TaxID=45668 RepID=UPI001CD29CBD|nr:ATP-dependent 6-phosphofructokinase [Halobacillus litoralis]MCA0970467.1 6-phosphofructokinase [Halobacillus litoralis]
MKRIAVLTSGPDAPGMNAAIRAVVRSGIYHNADMYGIQGGFQGLLKNEVKHMDAASVGSIMQRGGTILQSSPCDLVFTEDGQQHVYDELHKHEIDSLIVIGGKEAMLAASILERKGMPCVGIPATIDRDIPCVGETVGFDTALNTIVDYIDKIRDTATSHEKSSIIEVMGKDTGNLALLSGLAGGAENILIPEKKEDLDRILQEVQQGPGRHNRFRIIILAEGLMNATDLHRQLKEATGMESRVTSLGHTQRGGTPTARDRILASRLGAHAVDLVMDGESGKVVSIKDDQPAAFGFDEVVEKRADWNESLYELPKRLSI